jgi:uncharacterized membrane protein YkvA (DUF1232 family)
MAPSTPSPVASNAPTARQVVQRAVRLHTAHRFRLAWRLVRSPRVPVRARLPLFALLVYLALPLDIVPDFIPVLGQLDDVLIAGLAVWWFLRVCPPMVAMAEIERLERTPVGPLDRLVPWLLVALSGALLILVAWWFLGGAPTVIDASLVGWGLLLVGGWLAAAVSGAAGFGGALLA